MGLEQSCLLCGHSHLYNSDSYGVDKVLCSEAVTCSTKAGGSREVLSYSLKCTLNSAG